MAEWPTVEDVKLSLGVTTTARDSLISTAIKAAIEQVAVDLGYNNISVDEDSDSGAEGRYVLIGSLPDPDPYAEPVEVAEIPPTNSLNQAALILSVMAIKAPDAPYGIAAAFDLGAVQVAANHPTYQRMLTGQRLRFGIG